MARAPADRRYIMSRQNRGPGPGSAVVDNGDGDPTPLDPRYDLREHSPDGFQWSYGGSGPAQLALALTADAMGDDALTMRFYRRILVERVAVETADNWEITAGDVQSIVDKYADAAGG